MTTLTETAAEPTNGWISADDVQTLSPVFTALVTLTGTAVGFYFGGGKGGIR